MTNEMNNTAGAVRELPAKENKRKESRAVISAKAQTILDLLRNCKPYEADSIRVMVGYAVGTDDVESINETDMLSVNRFLNNGLRKLARRISTVIDELRMPNYIPQGTTNTISNDTEL